MSASTPADLPVRSLAVLPLVNPTAAFSTTQDRPVLGVVAVGRDHLEPFDAAQVRALQHLAGVVATLVAARAGDGDLADEDVDPGDDLAVVVGMLSERLATGSAEAMTRMRAHASTVGCTIHDVARAVPAGRTRLKDVAG